MGLLLLKSITCLLILLIFYKLILETLSNHKFKRAYLLIAILTSVITPFITFVKYVAPSVDKVLLIDNNTETIPLNTTFKIAEGTNYLAFVLWSLYAIGVSLFLIRFGKNVFGIVSKIKKHEKVKHNNFINVLIHQLEIPHTFFNFIFLNKNKFEHNQIPHEILLHEQTHAKQKHSLDILFIELLQIIFWFNPLLYWLKKEVKLNHEFLADQAVLNQGVDTKNYQNILLAFSSNQQEQVLVNAINYSSIKKRFTLMKTQTPKSVAWLRSLLLLPLLGVLIYSFSNTIEIEKETLKKIKNNLPIEDSIEQEITQIQNSILLVNGIECDGCKLNLSKEGIIGLILSTNNKEAITEFKLKIPGIKTLFNEANMHNNETRQYITRAKQGDIIQVFDIKTKSNKFKPVVIKVVDKNDENYSESPKVKKGDASSIPPPPPPPPVNPNATPEEKAKQEEVIEQYNKENKIIKGRVYKNFPPPPAPLNSDKTTGFVNIKGQTHFYVKLKSKTKYYNRDGFEVDKKGNKLSNTQTDGSKVIPGQKITKVFKAGKIVSEFKKTWNDEDLNLPTPPATTIPSKKDKELVEAKRAKLIARRNQIIAERNKKKSTLKKAKSIERKEAQESRRAELMEKRDARKIALQKRRDNMLPPPPPKSPLQHVIDMSKKGATFYYNTNKISSDKAIELIKQNKNLNISSNTDNGNSTVKISEKGIITINDN